MSDETRQSPTANVSHDVPEIPLWVAIAGNVRENNSDGEGVWRSCSGCYETEDGQNVHGYPHSEVFGCILGDGCSDCGGIGAIWDTTDYAAMAASVLAPDVAPFPEQLTPELREVLGMICFQCAPIAHAFRAAGADIATKAEAEQAYVIHWLVGIVLRHGKDWRTVAGGELEALHKQLTRSQPEAS
jgi:hypothetical protein